MDQRRNLKFGEWILFPKFYVNLPITSRVILFRSRETNGGENPTLAGSSVGL